MGSEMCIRDRLGQVMIVMGLCGMAVFAAMSLRRGERPLPRGVLAPMMLARDPTRPGPL